MTAPARSAEEIIEESGGVDDSRELDYYAVPKTGPAQTLTPLGGQRPDASAPAATRPSVRARDGPRRFVTVRAAC
jgi:hypothetical protein